MKRATILGLFLVALAGCYSGPGTSSKGDAALAIATPMDSDVPSGVVTPKPAVGSYSGIFKARGAEQCCWLSESASFQVDVPPKAKGLTVTVVLPSLDVYRRRPQGLTVRVNNGRPVVFSNLAIGQSELRVPLSTVARERIVTVQLRPAYAFVPKREGINGDTRLLSLYLSDVHASQR